MERNGFTQGTERLGTELVSSLERNGTDCLERTMDLGVKEHTEMVHNTMDRSWNGTERIYMERIILGTERNGIIWNGNNSGPDRTGTERYIPEICVSKHHSFYGVLST